MWISKEEYEHLKKSEEKLKGYEDRKHSLKTSLLTRDAVLTAVGDIGVVIIEREKFNIILDTCYKEGKNASRIFIPPGPGWYKIPKT